MDLQHHTTVTVWKGMSNMLKELVESYHAFDKDPSDINTATLCSCFKALQRTASMSTTRLYMFMPEVAETFEKLSQALVTTMSQQVLFMKILTEKKPGDLLVTVIINEMKLPREIYDKLRSIIHCEVPSDTFTV